VILTLFLKKIKPQYKKKYASKGGSLLLVIQLDCSTVSRFDKFRLLKSNGAKMALMAVHITLSVKS
jgi:hypothetical protein